MDHFKLVSEYAPTGDQPQAIAELVEGFLEGNQFETLLGVTGSGKTFTMANVIQALNKPTLIIAHNKTLAAQVYGEMKEFFPENAVEYFVSYYDYYQPEAYVPSTDTYIEKDSAINDEIDKLRHSATAALSERKDVIIVASVSCIYGLGSPIDYQEMVISLRPGMEKDRDEVIHKLIDIQYARNDMDFHRGTFRVRGDVLEIFPAYSDSVAYRVEFFGDEIDRIMEIDTLTGEAKLQLNHIAIFPASHYVVPKEKMQLATENILEELKERVTFFKSEDKLLEAQRISERTNFDVEMMRETGFCSGIENYSRHLNFGKPGEPPWTLIDYFPDDFLIIVDESHITLPQVRGMYAGDRSRKTTLVDYGFRLPSAKDNRPLNFDEFEKLVNKNTKAVIINSPNNPSGAVYSEQTIKKLADFLSKKSEEYGTHIFIITDEPYREIVYDGVEVPYVTKYYNDTIVCYSYSKSLSLPGERIGFILVPDEAYESKKLYAAVCGAGRALGYVCAPSLFQKVIAKCVGQTGDVNLYKKNRDLLYDGLTELGYECFKPDGAFYMFVKALESDAENFCEKAKEEDLLLVAATDFGCPGYVRISYCVDEDMIKRSFKAFKALKEKYAK